MTPDIVRDIAEQIINEQILSNWKFYLLIGAIYFLAHTLAEYASGYFKKTGETKATTAVLDQIVTQQQKTTEAIESVKSEIAHSDWSARERKMLRRTKLEQLWEAVHAVEEWEDRRMDHLIFSHGGDPGPSPIRRVKMIAGLYFPEVKKEVMALTQVHSEFSFQTAKGKAKLLSCKDPSERSAVVNEVAVYRGDQYKREVDAVEGLFQKLATLMDESVNA